VTGRVVVVGLGPGDPGLISAAAKDALAQIERRFVRTTRHPSASLAGPADSFDSIYDRAADLDEVYQAIVDHLVRESEVQPVLYAVPGSPLVAERTVELLKRDTRVEVSVIPALSFLDLAWERLGVDPVAEGVRLVDGHRFAPEAAGLAGPFLVAQCDSRLVMSEIKLTLDDGPRVTVMQRLGQADESIVECEWDDLDRRIAPDHLTCVWIPRMREPVAAEFVRFDALVRTLREQCPWDRSQTHQSLTRYLIEETYELLEAIDELDYDHLEEELGDLLYQITFHATLAREEGQFSLSDVARRIHDKLVERHPHVFGPPGTPVPNWEELKRAQKGRASVMDGVPGHLPSLLYAFNVQGKAASVGFDWQNAAGAWPKVHEELQELAEAMADGDGVDSAVQEELGDVLFSVVNVARHLGLDPEAALREAAAKFRDRFRAMEVLAAERGAEIDDDLWDEVKQGPEHRA
jgi:tetrapyrrole methylase family protein/MazG family protein